MTTTNSMILLLLGCMLVTWIPRVLPFIFVRSLKIPSILLRWLSYIPICILSALVIESLLQPTTTGVSIKIDMLIAFLPTLIVAFWTKSLSFTVIVGIVTMALIRFIS